MNELNQTMTRASRNAIKLYMAISAVVFLLMMIFGLVMRVVQSQWVDLPPTLFYQIMTAHGAGMIGISGLAASGVMWYFLRRYVKLSTAILYVNLAFFLLGVVLILGGIFIGGFGGAWTFLFPLPSNGLGAWGPGAATAFLVGLLLIGVGFLILYLDVARAILGNYGSLTKALGWPQLFGGKTDDMPPAAVVASTMVLIVNILGIISGAVVLVLILINLYIPSFKVDPLLAKNLTYFFGHVFINATIYQAVIGVYEILPKYTNRPWKVNKVFLAAWTASILMVLIVYPHHLLMDFAMPTWMLIMGQIISYTSGFPILVVTAYGALTIVYRSGIKWDVASGLLFLSMFGWSAGVVPAVIDGVISVNKVMHNTLWVPGHFHTYLILGLVAMIFGFMYYYTKSENEQKVPKLDGIAYWGYVVGGIGFVFMFLVSGSASVPRRWAVHYAEWISFSQVAAIFGALVVLSTLIFLLSFLFRLGNAKYQW